MAESIYLEVEENDNCEYMPLMVYEAHRDPVPIAKVFLDEPGRARGVYWVTGWSSEGPVPAMYSPVSDSGQATVHLIFGGDWGIRFKPEDSNADWGTANPDQFGEPYIMLTDESALILE